MEAITDKLQRESIELASLSRRALAFFIDDLIINVLFIVIYYPTLQPLFSDAQALINAISALVVQLLALKVLYHTFFIWRFGASIGKMACKIICIDATMLCTPSIWQAFLRACVRLLSEWCFYLGFAWAFGNSARQTWQDKLARTIVCDAK